MSRYLYGGNVNANSIRQHYLRYGGDGPPLVIVPGITSPAPTWGFVAEALAHEFDVYVVDARGRGLSESGDHLTHRLDDYADDIIAFLRVMGLRGSAVVGHSMGARILLRAMSRGLEADRVVLADPPVTGPGRAAYPTPLAWYVDSIRLAQAGAGPEALRRFTPTWTDDQIRLRAEWLHTCDERAVVASYDSFHEDDIRADLAQCAVPALLLVAGRGGVITPADVEDLRTIQPAVAVHIVAQAGHMIPWDDLQGFVTPVVEFLSGTPSPAVSLSKQKVPG